MSDDTSSNGAAEPTGDPVRPAIGPAHSEYATAAARLKLHSVELTQIAFETGTAPVSQEMDVRVTRNVSAFTSDDDAATIEFEIDVATHTKPEHARVWASVSRWRVAYTGARSLDTAAVYEVLVRVGFMTVYPYLRGTIAALTSQTRLALPPLPSVTISAFGDPPPLDEVIRRMPTAIIVHQDR